MHVFLTTPIRRFFWHVVRLRGGGGCPPSTRGFPDSFALVFFFIGVTLVGIRGDRSVNEVIELGPGPHDLFLFAFHNVILGLNKDSFKIKD